MLHNIDNSGNIWWHCGNPDCKYHNCQGWDAETRCIHHAETQRAQPAGLTHTAHISDPAIKWVSENEIELPPCPGCKRKTTVYVHNDIADPIITKDAQTGKILQVAMPQGAEHHGNLWIVDKDIQKKQILHPALAPLSGDQLKQVQSIIGANVPMSSYDWMHINVVYEDIHDVYKHPAVDRHLSLAQQLKDVGKTYQPPEIKPVQAVFTQEQVEEIIHQVLTKHGLLPQQSAGIEQTQPLPTQPATIDEYPALPPIRLP